MSALRSIFFLLLLSVPCWAQATVWTYSYPDTIFISSNPVAKNHRSHIYMVTIKQGEITKDSYVLADWNNHPAGNRDKMTDWNHLTCFSFDGTVQVEIVKNDGSDIGTCSVYPLAHEIPFEIVEQNKVVITLDRPMKIYVEMEGMDEHPLFIFADPPEGNPPLKDDPDVLLIEPGWSAAEVKNAINTTDKTIIYFKEGVHSFGTETGDNYAGYQLPLRSSKVYYIPGGTYLRASLYGENLDYTSVTGRGIVSLCGIEKTDVFEYHSIFFNNGGEHHVVTGITILDPTHYCVLSRGDLKCTNTKMFGWYYSTDGFGGNHGSAIDDCFLKVNDDAVKIYRDNQVATNLVIYKQINGAAFQLGWNPYGQAYNGLIKNIYIIKDDPKFPSGTSNTAVINLVNNEGSTISFLTFDSIYIENDVQRIIGIRLNGGELKFININNLFLRGKSNVFNYIYAENGGVVNNITLYNHQFNGECITTTQNYNLQLTGDINNLYFTGCPDEPNSSIDMQTTSDNTVALLQDPLYGGKIECIPDHPNREYSIWVCDYLGKIILAKPEITGQQSITLTYPGLFIVKIRSGSFCRSTKILNL